MRKLWIGAVVVLVGVGIASLAAAQPGPRHVAFWKSEKMVEKLSLTDEQVTKLDNIDYKFQKSSIELNAGLKSAQLSLEHFLSGEKIKKQQLEGLVDEIAQARGEQTKLMLQKKIAIRKVLSLEQWKKIETGRAHMRRRMGNRRQGGGPGHLPHHPVERLPGDELPDTSP